MENGSKLKLYIVTSIQYYCRLIQFRMVRNLKYYLWGLYHFLYRPRKQFLRRPYWSNDKYLNKVLENILYGFLADFIVIHLPTFDINIIAQVSIHDCAFLGNRNIMRKNFFLQIIYLNYNLIFTTFSYRSWLFVFMRASLGCNHLKTIG